MVVCWLFEQVNLRDGVPKDCVNQTCTSGAGSLLLEFGLLSRLLNDPIYDYVARVAVNTLWNLKSNVTGLFGQCVSLFYNVHVVCFQVANMLFDFLTSLQNIAPLFTFHIFGCF